MLAAMERRQTRGGVGRGEGGRVQAESSRNSAGHEPSNVYWPLSAKSFVPLL